VKLKARPAIIMMAIAFSVFWFGSFLNNDDFIHSFASLTAEIYEKLWVAFYATLKRSHGKFYSFATFTIYNFLIT